MSPRRRKLVVAAGLGVLIVAVLGAIVVRTTNSEDSEGVVRWRSSERVAFDGTTYFVVWVGNDGADGIYGARVSQDGAVLDQTPITISTRETIGEDPRVAFNGTSYLVAWTDAHDGTIGDAWDVYAARVGPAGEVFDRTGIPIATVANDQQVGGVASDGTDFLVVWDGVDEQSLDYTIRGARVDEAGEVLDPEGFVISKGAEEQVTPSVAFDGRNYLVAWADRRGWPDSNIYGTRVSKAGNVLDPAGIKITRSPRVLRGPSISVGDDQYLVVWTHFRKPDDWNYDVRGARVSSAGTVLDPDGLLIGFAPDEQWLPSAAFDGTNYVVAWEDLRRGSAYVYGTRVSRAGTVLEPGGTAISKAVPRQAMPSVGFGDTNYLVTWMEERDEGGSVFDIYGARVDKDGEVIDRPPIPISTAKSR